MEYKYQRRINKRVAVQITQFMNNEKAGGIILSFAVILALILGNSPFRVEYEHFFQHHFGFLIDGRPYLNFSLEHWINDGLMCMFFFVVGLELKREFIGGELRNIRDVVLPSGAAIMGMVVPSVIFLAFNHGTPNVHGWGIPMATDIAFALAVVYILGNRVPLAAKVFLTTLAIVDDLGSVLVIAFFYTSNISIPSIGIGVSFLCIMFIANRLGVKSIWFYAILCIGGVWTAFLMSGIHVTISAVLSAFMIPADSSIPEATFISRLKSQLRSFEHVSPNDVMTLEEEQVEIISKVKETSKEAIPPLQRLEHSLHPFVSFFIIPIFALSNSGVNFVDMDFGNLFSNNIVIGVFLGLFVGKPIGILLSTWVLTRLKLARLNSTMTWHQLVGIGFLASIGFTMSMFVTTLAYDDSVQIIQAKVGIFSASILGGVVGYILLRKADKKKEE